MTVSIAPGLRDLFLGTGIRDELDNLRRALACPRVPVPCGSISADGSVLVGNDDWLFVHGGGNDWQQQASGRLQLTPFGLEQWAQLLSRRKSHFDDIGIRYALLIVPEKSCVYSEYLPEGTSPSQQRPVMQLLPLLGSETSYPLTPLRAGKALAPTYYRQNSHWTWFGAYLAAAEIWRRLGILEKEMTPALLSRPVQQDLASKFDCFPDGNYHELDVADRLIFTNQSEIGGHVGRFKHLHNPDAPYHSRVLICGDSYAYDHNLAAWFSFQYRDVFCSWQFGIQKALVEATQPDIVVAQIAERFLIRLPTDALE